MKASVYTQKYMWLMAAVFALGALALAPAVMAQNGIGATAPNLVVTITDTGITQSIPTPEAGLYTVTIRNDSSRSRGVVMQGVDLCCAPFIRFTRVLTPGAQETFRWYFPSDRVVEFRDLLRCVPAERTCAVAQVGGFTSTMVVV